MVETMDAHSVGNLVEWKAVNSVGLTAASKAGWRAAWRV